MSLNKDDVLKIILLARLDAAEEDLDTLIQDSNNILEYVEKLAGLNVDGIDPLAHVHESQNVLREDKMSNALSTVDALANAPERSGNFIKVPLVIE